jgi:predicted nucleotidyltransferase
MIETEMNPEMIKKIAEYFRNRTEVIAVYLFGSYAKGHERTSSDIDIGVLIEHEALADDKDVSMIYTVNLGRLLRKDCHVLIMNNAGEGVLAQIFNKGKCIFQRDPETLSRFKAFSYSMIADFGYHRNIMEKRIVSKILGADQ